MEKLFVLQNPYARTNTWPTLSDEFNLLKTFTRTNPSYPFFQRHFNRIFRSILGILAIKSKNICYIHTLAFLCCGVKINASVYINLIDFFEKKKTLRGISIRIMFCFPRYLCTMESRHPACSCEHSCLLFSHRRQQNVNVDISFPWVPWYYKIKMNSKILRFFHTFIVKTNWTFCKNKNVC